MPERRTLLDQLADPEPRDLGAFVELPDGTVGQVWALHTAAKVWVADGAEYRLVQVKALVVSGAAMQVEQPEPSADEPSLFDLGDADA